MNEQLSSDGIDELRRWLIEDEQISSPDAEMHALSGGVSSDVVLVRDNGKEFIAKRALPQLRVKDDWFANVERNQYEHRYMRVAGEIVPHSIPDVIHTNDQRGFFCMTSLGDDWSNWKSLLLEGHADVSIAKEAAKALGMIHRHTANRHDLAMQFDTLKNFHDLRIEPYLLTTGQRHPDLQPYFVEEADRLARSHECLVHGDYSPKNLLVRNGQIMILDCEVAWYGAPSFDLAFLLNHLLLKALYLKPHRTKLLQMASAAMPEYFRTRDLHQTARLKLQSETLRLLMMLMLARVDGKSPVEYLQGDTNHKDHIRSFVRRYLNGPPFGNLEQLTEAFIRHSPNGSHENQTH